YCRYDEELAYTLNFANILRWNSFDVATDFEQRSSKVCRVRCDDGRATIGRVLAVARECPRDKETNNPYRRERDEKNKDVVVPPVATYTHEEPEAHEETRNRRDEARDSHNEHISVLDV